MLQAQPSSLNGSVRWLQVQTCSDLVTIFHFIVLFPLSLFRPVQLLLSENKREEINIMKNLRDQHYEKFWH